MQPKDTAISSLERSGFPFQTAVSEVVSRETSLELRESEFPWLDRHDADQFLDLVFSLNALYVAIECKKTDKETLTFLSPEGPGEPANTERARVVLTRQIRDSTGRLESYNVGLRVIPESPEAEFCVVATEKKGQNVRLLERDCRLVLGGSDAYARRRRGEKDPEARRRAKESGSYTMCLVHVPVLVTNAPLFVAAYDPAKLSLETARFEEMPDLKRVPAVRFTKSFAAPVRHDLGHRTVFVVSAASLTEFLASLVAPDLGEVTGGVNIA